MEKKKQMCIGKTIISICLVCLSIFNSTACGRPANQEPQTLDEILIALEHSHEEVAQARNELNELFNAGYGYNHAKVKAAEDREARAMAKCNHYSDTWDIYTAEYPIAASVWQFLRIDCGYSPEVAAGILGNMMVECGGLTLNLQWDIYNASKHYGLCQWSSKYYPELQGASLREQLDFLKVSIVDVMNRYGKDYKKGFNHDKFVALTDCRTAAHVFSLVYERPGTNSTRRQNCAETALKYFTAKLGSVTDLTTENPN